jgi:hypothetical protein
LSARPLRNSGARAFWIGDFDVTASGVWAIWHRRGCARKFRADADGLVYACRQVLDLNLPGQSRNSVDYSSLELNRCTNQTKASWIARNAEFRIVYLCFISFIPSKTLSPRCGGIVAFAKGCPHAYSQQDRGVDATAVGAAGAAEARRTHASNGNIGWRPRLRIPNPNHCTQQRANSNYAS